MRTSKNSDWIEVKVMGVLILCLLLAAIGLRALRIHVLSVPMTISVGSKIVYQGPSACTQIESAGAATIVRIGGGPLCLLPKARYAGNNITATGTR